jgi:hypothetical protein
MKQELSPDYEINVENMIPFTENNSQKGMNLFEASFYNNKGKKIKMLVLKNNEEPGNFGCKQIFQMKDGTFILEEENEDVEYYFSKNLQDLL